MDPALVWIVAGGLGRASIALVGAFTLLLGEPTLRRILKPLVALSAGSLIGGALFHMIPASVETMGNTSAPFLWVAAGFVTFLALEQFLHWHHCHQAPSEHKHPLGYLVLMADTVHNLIAGCAFGAAMLVDIRLGFSTWLATVSHEVPQELGDFGVLLHGGWRRGQALLFNFLSATTFLAGALLVYLLARNVDVSFLVPFAAGNFLYLGATDLVPEVNKHHTLRGNVAHFACFLVGLAFLYFVHLWFEGGHAPRP